MKLFQLETVYWSIHLQILATTLRVHYRNPAAAGDDTCAARGDVRGQRLRRRGAVIEKKF